MAAVVDAVVALPGILVVATKSCVVDKDTPSDCHVAAGCRGAGVDECRSSLRVASCTGSQETHTENSTMIDTSFTGRKSQLGTTVKKVKLCFIASIENYQTVSKLFKS